MSTDNKKHIWNKIKETNIYPEYKTRKIFNDQGYFSSNKFYSYYKNDGYNRLKVAKEIDFVATKSIKLYPSNYKSKSDVSSTLLFDYSFIGDVKYSERESKDISFIGLKTNVNISKYKWYNDYSPLQHLVKWFQIKNENFIEFAKWDDIHYVEDYLTYPVSVNHKLISREQYMEMDKTEKYHKGDIFKPLKEKINDNFGQIINAWLVETHKIKQDLKDSHDNDTIERVGLISFPILVFGNNPNLYVVSMEDYYSNESSEADLKDTDFLVYNAQVPNEILNLNRDMLNEIGIGLSIPIIITTVEKLQKTIQTLERNLLKAEIKLKYY